MKNCCVSIEALYDRFGENLPSGNTIDAYSSDGYYDLRDKWGNLVCMDGEECEVSYEPDSQMYKFTNRNGELDTVFYLMKEEADCTIFN